MYFFRPNPGEKSNLKTDLNKAKGHLFVIAPEKVKETDITEIKLLVYR